MDAGLNIRTASDADVLTLLKEASAVTLVRPERKRYRVPDKAILGAALDYPGVPFYKAIDLARERLLSVYDTHAAEIEAVEVVNDPAQWTEAQKWMRR